MSDSPSYNKKLDPRLLPEINAILGLCEIFGISDGGADALAPDFFDKFKNEGCPDWTHIYGSKIPLRKFFVAIWNGFPSEIQSAFQGLRDLKDLKARKVKADQLIEKYLDEIGNAIVGV